MRGGQQNNRARSYSHNHLLPAQERVADELAGAQGNGAVVVRHDGQWWSLLKVGCERDVDGFPFGLVVEGLAGAKIPTRSPCRLIGSNPKKMRVCAWEAEGASHLGLPPVIFVSLHVTKGGPRGIPGKTAQAGLTNYSSLAASVQPGAS